MLNLAKICRLMLVSVVFSGAVHGATIRLSEPVQSDADSETFGALIETLPPRVELSKLVSEPSSYLGKPLTLHTKVAKVCQKKGCFFIAQQGSDKMRVAFKDYGFFVPTDIAGKEVHLVGELIVREV